MSLRSGVVNAANKTTFQDGRDSAPALGRSIIAIPTASFSSAQVANCGPVRADQCGVSGAFR